MKRFFTRTAAGLALLAAALAGVGAMPLAGAAAPDTVTAAPSHGPGAGATPAPTALDPAVQRLFMTLAMSVLSNFATNAARGSLDAFDPGPAIEAALSGALHSRDLDAVIDRLVAQAGAGSESSGASPEMRAMLKTALSGVIAMARSEMRRELSSGDGPRAAAPGTP